MHGQSLLIPTQIHYCPHHEKISHPLHGYIHPVKTLSSIWSHFTHLTHHTHRTLSDEILPQHPVSHQTAATMHLFLSLNDYPPSDWEKFLVQWSTDMETNLKETHAVSPLILNHSYHPLNTHTQWFHHAFTTKAPPGQLRLYSDIISLWHSVSWSIFRELLLCDPDSNSPRYINHHKFPPTSFIPCEWSDELISYIKNNNIPALIPRII